MNSTTVYTTDQDHDLLGSYWPEAETGLYVAEDRDGAISPTLVDEAAAVAWLESRGAK